MENDFFTNVFENDIENEPQFFQNLTEEEQEEVFEETMDPLLRSDVENLLTSGAISKEVEVAGHVFVLRTLTIGEELAVAQACRDFEDTTAQAKAIATATVAAALETIDGRPVMRSLGPDLAANIRQKFQYIRNKWYWIIILELYENYTTLLDRQTIAFNELRKK